MTFGVRTRTPTSFINVPVKYMEGHFFFVCTFSIMLEHHKMLNILFVQRREDICDDICGAVASFNASGNSPKQLIINQNEQKIISLFPQRYIFRCCTQGGAIRLNHAIFGICELILMVVHIGRKRMLIILPHTYTYFYFIQLWFVPTLVVTPSSGFRQCIEIH